MSRKHMEGILDIATALGQEFWPAFEGVWAPEEVYFPTCLALLGYLSGDNVMRQPLTYAEWNERAKVHRDRAHPLVFDGCFENDAAFIGRIRRNGCTFLRKVKRPISIRLWEDVVPGASSDSERGQGRGRGRDNVHDYGRGREHASSRRKRDRSDDDQYRDYHGDYSRRYDRRTR